MLYDLILVSIMSASICSCLYAGDKVNKLTVQTQVGLLTRELQLSDDKFLSFMRCMCHSKFLVTQCVAVFTNSLLTVNFDRQLKANCSTVSENRGLHNVTLNFESSNVQCSVTATAAYIHISSKPEQCPLNCAALLRYRLNTRGSQQTELVFNESAKCYSPCCAEVFGNNVYKGASLTTSLVPRTKPKTISTKWISYTTRGLPTTWSVFTKSKGAQFKVSTKPSYVISEIYNITTIVKSEAKSGSFITVMVSILITALLAFSAIIISSIACWRHKGRVKITLSEAALQAPTNDVRPSSVSESLGNIYSVLNHNNLGSTHNYYGLTQCHREYDSLIYSGALPTLSDTVVAGRYVNVPIPSCNDWNVSERAYDYIQVIED